MAYFNFENGKTALNDTNLKAMQKGLLELVFPIGSTYITQTNTNPSTILEFGTWERFKGVLAVGLDEDDFNEIGKKGGEKKHKMTIDELVKHNHIANLSSSNVFATTSNGAWATSYDSGNPNVETSFTGNSQPFNIVQPYEVVGYMWIRRA